MLFKAFLRDNEIKICQYTFDVPNYINMCANKFFDRRIVQIACTANNMEST